MRKLSIVLLLIGMTFMTIEANNQSESRSKRLAFKRWNTKRKALIPIPIEATLEENSIEVRFLENTEHQVTFQVKDYQGNILFHDMVIPTEQEVYKIDLQGFQVGDYELLYIEENVTFIGEFEIEGSSPKH